MNIKNVKKWYHASPSRFKIGEILTGYNRKSTAGKGKTYFCYLEDYIYLSAHKMPHKTIIEQAYKNNWNIYEVEPLYEVELGNWDDGVCEAVKVTKYIGTSRGFINNRHKNKNKNLIQIGSIVKRSVPKWVGGRKVYG